MTRRLAAGLVWTLCLGLLVLAVLGFARLWGVAAHYANFGDRLLDAVSGFLGIPFAVVAALIVARQPRNGLGWLLTLPALSLTPSALLTAYLAAAVRGAAARSGLTLGLIWYSNWSWLLLITPFLLILQLFPTGRPLAGPWRWLSVGVGLGTAYFAAIVLFSPTWTLANTDLSIANPLPWTLPQALSAAAVVVHLVGMLLTAGLSVGAAWVRYTRAAALERAQIKWFAWASTVFLAVLMLGLPLRNSGSGPLTLLFGLAFDLSLAGLPAAIAIAILRYRLFDIDLIIRRTLIYSALTAILALTYFGLVITLQSFVTALGGRQAEWVTVASTLAVAGLILPLRNRVQAFIDKRFYRRKYDAAKTLAAFAAVARDEPDLNVLTGKLAGVVQETMEPESVTIWLKR